VIRHAHASPFTYDPSTDPYPDWLRQVLQTWLDDGVDAAADALRQHPYRRRPDRPGEGRPLPRKNPRPASQYGIPADAAAPSGGCEDRHMLPVWLRDGWLCCLCRRPLFAPAALHLIACGFFGRTNDHGDPLFPWGPTRSFNDFHQSVWPAWAVIGHMWPRARRDRPGHATDARNLAAICWQCNDRQGESFLEELPNPPGTTTSAPRDDWDGLVALYLAIMNKDSGRRPDPVPLPYPGSAKDPLATHTRKLAGDHTLYTSAVASTVDLRQPTNCL
jgi:hypothetical protein